MGRELNLGWPSGFVWCGPRTLNWAAERRKTGRGGTAPAQTDRPVESERQSWIEQDREIEIEKS
jgi:hypothetical protein